MLDYTIGCRRAGMITGRGVPGTNDITGISHASATVTVDGASAYRKGEYFWKEVLATNASGVARQTVTNMAVMAGTTNTVTVPGVKP